MCGICGIWYFDPVHQVDATFLRTMTEQIVHRGPDEVGYHVDGSLGLCFRRLSIIDVGGSHQPMPNEDEQVWIIFNGEIYNYQELRDQLVNRHQFRTVGDTETILHAYEEYGANCVDQLRGMFAFAVWDKRQQSITLAVDRFGKKPLYYYLDHEKLIWGSELKCILQYPGLARDIDFEALDEYLTYGFVTAPRSIFTAIRKVPPGHTICVNRNGQAHSNQYWHPYFYSHQQTHERSADDLAAELRELLLDSVRLRMISDVPLGAFLSGGVDSSSIVSLMSQVSTRPVKTFSIGFDDSVYDETSYAQLVANYCKTEHVREVVRPDVINILPKLIHQFDEPFADSSMIPTYYVSQIARQYVTVALSGDGGDEVFGGYLQYIYGYRHHLLHQIIPASLRPSARRIGKSVPRATKLKPYLAVVDQPTHYWGMRTGFFNAAQRRNLYTDMARRQLGTYESEQIKVDIFKRIENYDWLAQLQYSDLMVYMPGDILVKVDRASMLASLEIRCPLLDHKVFEFMARVPPHYKINGWNTKILLKKALGSWLPAPIHKRHKWGFSVPMAKWLVGPLRSMLQDVLFDPNAYSRSLFDTNFIQSLVDEHIRGDANHDERLWSLLCFELWAREYLHN